MIALLIVLTFLFGILVDHLLTRHPILVAEERRPQVPARPHLLAPVVAGFEVPANLRYHPGHTWVAAETPSLVRVGIDDLAAKVAGEISEVDIPERGQWIRQGQRIIALKRGGQKIELVSPIEGTVTGINTEAVTNPSKVTSDPYGDGWLLMVHSPDADTNFRNLLSGQTARRWMDEAAATLRGLLHPPAAAYAQDGGLALPQAMAELPDAELRVVQRELFLN